MIWPKHFLDKKIKTIKSRAHPNLGTSKLAKDRARTGGQVPVTGVPSAARATRCLQGEGSSGKPRLSWSPCG